MKTKITHMVGIVLRRVNNDLKGELKYKHQIWDLLHDLEGILNECLKENSELKKEKK